MSNRLAKPKTEIGPCSCTALRKATRRVSQLYDTALEPCGLRTTQRAILNHIERGGAPSVGELAEALVLERGGLAHTLKPLERDGLVTVTIDPADRRNRLVQLTAVGRAKLAESEALWANAQRSFEAAIGVAEGASLKHALALILAQPFSSAFQARMSRTKART
jgi:DNA-binding MarR family transcriptional regulator